MIVSEKREWDFAVASIEIEFGPAHAPAFAAVVRLCGEHDIATSAGLREALAAIQGSVRVDLSDCAFVESTVITAFVLDSRERAREGQRLELVVPAANATVTRALQVSGLTEVLTVHEAHEFNQTIVSVVMPSKWIEALRFRTGRVRLDNRDALSWSSAPAARGRNR